MKPQKVVFIVIAYRPLKRDLRPLLTALKDLPVIVVDNGKTLKKADVGKVTLLTQRRNHGYPGAANRGIHYASAHGATWFVVLNQDFHMNRKDVLHLIRTLKSLSPCVAGPFPGGLDTKRWTTILPSERVDYLTGSCLAIHEKVIRKTGYFHEPYFLYYEDADYCLRAKDKGFNLVRLELGKAKHRESKSLGQGSYLHQYYLSRNHMLFVERIAPIRVKLYEMVRFPKTLSEHILRHESGALMGLLDYGIRRFGKTRKEGYADRH